MTSSVRQYSDGDIIFLEGQVSDMAFVIVEGNVKISKSHEKGAVPLAVLGPGELFGEMGVLDRGTRSATALAQGKVTLKAIPGETFLDSLKADPNMAMAVMDRLVQRLRVADNMLVRPPTVERAPWSRRESSGSGGPGLLKRLFSLGSRAASRRITIWIADAPGEQGPRLTRHLRSALGRQRGVQVRSMGKILAPVDDGIPGEQYAAAAKTARKWLDQVGGDLLVWGRLLDPETTLRLNFVSAAMDEEDRPGIFDLATALDLPAEFDSRLAPVLRAVCLAAITPTTPEKEIGRSRALLAALEEAIPATNDLPQDLTAGEAASIQLCHGNTLATAAADRGSAELYQTAVGSYQSAVDGFDSTGPSVQGALAQKQMGAALQALAEFTDDPLPLEAASDAYRKALKVLTLEAYPWEWAATQNRLGSVLYKLYLRTNDVDMLKRSLAASQESLQVITRQATPRRWAEVMYNFAQAARELGEQLQNAEVLEKAADACRAALEIRTREASPFQWAATQIGLGSTLFFLGKLSRNQEHVLAAAHAFEQAHDFYEGEGAVKLASITRKNIERLHPLLKIAAPRDVPKMAWEDDEE